MTCKYKGSVPKVLGMNQPKATAAELLASAVVLTTTEVATVLRLTYVKGARKGQPKRKMVIDLVDRGLLSPIDPSEPSWRWRFSTASVNRYLGQVAA